MSINIPGLPARIDTEVDGAPTEAHPGSEALIGCDGNAFAIMGTVARILRRAGCSAAYEKQYIADATSGDYDNLLAVSVRYLDA